MGNDSSVDATFSSSAKPLSASSSSLSSSSSSSSSLLSPSSSSASQVAFNNCILLLKKKSYLLCFDESLSEKILEMSEKGIVKEVEMLIDSGADPKTKEMVSKLYKTAYHCLTFLNR